MKILLAGFIQIIFWLYVLIKQFAFISDMKEI